MKSVLRQDVEPSDRQSLQEERRLLSPARPALQGGDTTPVPTAPRFPHSVLHLATQESMVLRVMLSFVMANTYR